jgi:uncharacterized Zn ribbon protein
MKCYRCKSEQTIYPFIDPIFCEECFEDMSHCTDISHDSEPNLPCDKCWKYWSDKEKFVNKDQNEKFNPNVQVISQKGDIYFLCISVGLSTKKNEIQHFIVAMNKTRKDVIIRNHNPTALDFKEEEIIQCLGTEKNLWNNKTYDNLIWNQNFAEVDEFRHVEYNEKNSSRKEEI